jgi:hypothetical protein
MTPTSLVREKPVKPVTPVAHSTPAPRPPIVTRAESAPCTCPEPCERDHEND